MRPRILPTVIRSTQQGTKGGWSPTRTVAPTASPSLRQRVQAQAQVPAAWQRLQRPQRPQRPQRRRQQRRWRAPGQREPARMGLCSPPTTPTPTHYARSSG